MRTNRGYLFRAFNSKAISHHHLYLADIKKLAEELESFTVKKKKKREASVLLWLDIVSRGKLEMG